jgi:hypothetical protein
MEIEESWIKNFKHQDKQKDDDVINLNLFYLYVNRYNHLIDVKEGPTYILQSKIFDKSELIHNIKTNSFHNNQKYKLLSMLKYNIDIDINNLDEFINKDQSGKFMSPLSNLENVNFSKSIKMFNDLNSIFLIFHENVTPRYTKKIMLTSSKRKTKHKRYKD